MKKMKKRNIVILAILGSIVLLIVFLVNAKYIFYPKYEYISSGYAYGGTIDINGVIYEEIREEMYSNIERMLGIDSSTKRIIGRIDYVEGSYNVEYYIYGNRSVEDRILLIGNVSEIVDANWHDPYFCRKDTPLFTEDHVRGVTLYIDGNSIEYGNDIADELVFYINRAEADMFSAERKYYFINRDDVMVARVNFEMDFESVCRAITTITANQNGYYINIIEYFAGVPIKDNGSAEIPYELVQRIFGEDMPTAEEYMKIIEQ